MQATNVKMAGAVMGFVAALLIGPAAAAAQTASVKPAEPCKTTGNLEAGAPDPATYSYTLGSTGSVSGGIPVTAPSVSITGQCDPTLAATFGQTDLTEAPITMYVQSVSVGEFDVDGATFAAIRAAFAFGTVTLKPGETAPVPFTFTNAGIPAGAYDIHIKSNAGGTINDINARGFTLTASVPSAVDTLAPDVTITAPAAGSRVLHNGTLNIAFSANDPEENGAGTGVTSVNATVTSAGGAVNQSIASLLASSSGLPVAAGVTVNLSGAATATAVGSYILTAEATDGASHTGSAAQSFTVGVNVSCLPPISIAGRQFNVGSTVPVKWTFTDANGTFLAPFTSIKAVISAAGVPDTTALAGAGSSNIRWEVDATGSATQYIVNYPVPAAGKLYTARFFVNDVDGNSVEQGSCTFLSGTTGGKVR